MRKIVLALSAVAALALGAHAFAGAEGSLPPTNPALYDSNTFAPSRTGGTSVKTQDRMAQAVAPTTQVTTSAPVSSTTIVKGGNLAAQIIEWLQVAFGSTIGAAFLWVLVRGLNYIGIKITAEQKSQLQSIVVNGINSAAAKAATDLRNNPGLDINIKSQVVADAVRYAQDHGAETIQALGLDPKSGDAVEAIKARIETALNDPTTPTAASVTPSSGLPASSQPLAPAV